MTFAKVPYLGYAAIMGDDYPAKRCGQQQVYDNRISAAGCAFTPIWLVLTSG